MKFVASGKPVTTKNTDLANIWRNRKEEWPEGFSVGGDGTDEDKDVVGVMVEVPQIDDGVDGLIKFHSGAENLVDFNNSQYDTNAKNVSRVPLRNLDGKINTVELLKEAVATIKKAALEYVPQKVEKGPSVKVRAQTFDELAALVQSDKEFTLDDLKAILAKAK